MKKRLVALFMVGMLSFSMLAGCGKDASDEGVVKIEEDADTKDTEQEEGSSLSIDTKDFDNMMDAYKDYYNEFCDENLKPYYEDHSDCDCAARFVVNPDDNNIMMVIADIVDAAGDEMKVDLYFYEYKSGKVKEYLSIPSIWTTTDGIYVGNIVDELYVSTTTYPNGGQYEHTQYRIADGKAEEITQSKEDDEEWIDIETSNEVFEYALPYNLSERIFTDCDSDANKYCVSERDFEDCIDYLKENVPDSITALKVIYGDFLIENRITSNPDTYVLIDDVCYFYVDTEKDRPEYPLEYDKDAVMPTNTGFFIPCVKDMSGSEFLDSIDGYPIYQIKEDDVLSKYINAFNSNIIARGIFVDIDSDGTPECIVSKETRVIMYYIDSEGRVVCHNSDSIDFYYKTNGNVIITYCGEPGTLSDDPEPIGLKNYEFQNGSITNELTISNSADEYDDYLDEAEDYIDVRDLDGWRNGIIAAWKAYNNEYSDYEFKEWCGFQGEYDSNNGGEAAETSAVEGADTADAGSATTSSSSADDEILQKYQDYIDANYSYNIIDNGGCVFYDIDGDGTPELLCNITAQFQTILYEDCNGDISEINGVQWSGAGDGRIIQRSEAGGIYYNYLSEGIVVDTVYIEVELEPTDNDPYAGRYYYSYGDIYDEISDSEYQSYLDEIEADNMLIPTWSLYNDVCHGSDIQGAWDLYQKYN